MAVMPHKSFYRFQLRMVFPMLAISMKLVYQWRQNGEYTI